MSTAAPVLTRRIGFQPKPKPEPVKPFTRIHTCGGLLHREQEQLGTAACLAAFEDRLRREKPHPRINGLPNVRPTSYCVEFDAWYGYAHDTYSVTSNEPAVIRRLTAALLAATTLPPMSQPTDDAYDWASIRQTFEFNMLGREQDDRSPEYCQPLRYSVVRPAPSPQHQELSELLWAMRPLFYRLPLEDKAANAAQLEQLQAEAYALKQQIWRNAHPLPAAPAPAPLRTGPGIQGTLF
ncbi:hypothetical protein [Hymenobacter jeollabukensis]|uniref:Uncharacterized protein n=1 Tax=Hymenobacter jeollabukensis TaxID=2025313 RepID=A0A5R8WJB4_9BACT|nr:hypothetical protein [Hymenobacter jeollabukensis]TLM88693.1 hypothetical protein FDY95_22935 [Hymenobacter jeollabukensis]